MTGRAWLVLLLSMSLPVLSTACTTSGGGKAGDLTVTVSPETPAKPHLLTAASVISSAVEISRAIGRANVGLRIGGERKGIRLRYGYLDAAGEETLLEALDLTPESFSPPVGFAAEDTVVIRHQVGNRSSWVLHLIPRETNGEIDRLEVGCLMRPENGALLPVIRGTIPVGGSGTLLLTLSANENEAYAGIVELLLAGTDRRAKTEAIRDHRVEVNSFTLGTRDLADLYRLKGIEERGGPGGLDARVLSTVTAKAFTLALGEAGHPPARMNAHFGSDLRATVRIGGLSLLIETEHSPVGSGYRTSLRLENRDGAPTLELEHAEGRAILLTCWDAESPGTSTAAILRIAPVD